MRVRALFFALFVWTFTFVVQAFAEPVSADAQVKPVPLQVHGMAVPVPERVAPAVQIPPSPDGEVRSVQAQVIVVESPRRISLESLRRSEHRFPDHGMGSRFLEMSTELPPLFGEEAL